LKQPEETVWPLNKKGKAWVEASLSKKIEMWISTLENELPISSEPEILDLYKLLPYAKALEAKIAALENSNSSDTTALKALADKIEADIKVTEAYNRNWAKDKSEHSIAKEAISANNERISTLEWVLKLIADSSAPAEASG
jgi:hypothetical protein